MLIENNFLSFFSKAAHWPTGKAMNFSLFPLFLVSCLFFVIICLLLHAVRMSSVGRHAPSVEGEIWFRPFDLNFKIKAHPWVIEAWVYRDLLIKLRTKGRLCYLPITKNGVKKEAEKLNEETGNKKKSKKRKMKCLSCGSMSSFWKKRQKIIRQLT